MFILVSSGLNPPPRMHEVHPTCCLEKSTTVGNLRQTATMMVDVLRIVKSIANSEPFPGPIDPLRVTVVGLILRSLADCDRGRASEDLLQSCGSVRMLLLDLERMRRGLDGQRILSVPRHGAIAPCCSSTDLDCDLDLDGSRPRRILTAISTSTSTDLDLDFDLDLDTTEKEP